jgi:ABC-type tungstate transport system substrate-binding protein
MPYAGADRDGAGNQEIRADVGERANREREQTRAKKLLEYRVSRVFGLVAAAVGLLLAVVGGLSPSYVGPVGELGLVFGALGYLLGVRWLGGAVVVASAAEILIGLLT